jgi:hypothetical protein
LPGDEFITEMDPVVFQWLALHYFQDFIDKGEERKNLAYSIGWFQNPELVNKILENEQNSFSVSDEDFEASLQILQQSNEPTIKPNLKKRKLKKA